MPICLVNLWSFLSIYIVEPSPRARPLGLRDHLPKVEVCDSTWSQFFVAVLVRTCALNRKIFFNIVSHDTIRIAWIQTLDLEHGTNN